MNFHLVAMSKGGLNGSLDSYDAPPGPSSIQTFQILMGQTSVTVTCIGTTLALILQFTCNILAC